MTDTHIRTLRSNGLFQGANKVLRLTSVSFRKVHCLHSDNNHSEDNLHKLQDQQINLLET